MLDLPLPADIREYTDIFIAHCNKDKWDLIHGLDMTEFNKFSDSNDFEECLSWQIYCHRALKQFDFKIVVAEDILQGNFWNDVKKRSHASEKVHIRKAGSNIFIANGSSDEYRVNTFSMKCTCSDFLYRGIKTGMHCKHLIAALKMEGIWDSCWGQYIPN